MTTIVCNRTTMSADTQVTQGNTKSSIRKLSRSGDAIYGYAGEVSRCMELIRWLSGRRKTPPKQLRDIEVLVLSAGGIHHYVESLEPTKVTEEFTAIGSGHHAALGALHMGATPAEAVRIASKIDCFTGGRIHTIHLYT